MSLWASRSGLVRECHRCSQARAVLVPASLFSELMKRQVPSADVAAPAHSETPSKRQRRLVVSHAGPAERLKTPPTRSSEGDSGDGIWFIVGLGNPGPRYESTRHNVGFMIVDELARAHSIDCRKLEKSAAVGKGTIAGKQVLLVKPMTFMNNSGEAVSALAKFYKVPTKRILVISDDLDIPHAALRLRAKGGHGGHNGLRSITERLGNTQDYPRLKVGIGRPSGPIAISSWVLQDFSSKEMESMSVAVQEGCDIVRKVLEVGIDKAVSTMAPKDPPAQAKAKKAPAPAGAQQPQQQGSGGKGAQQQPEVDGKGGAQAQTQVQAKTTADVLVSPSTAQK